MRRYAWAPRNSRSRAIAAAVTAHPGHTAHWYCRGYCGLYGGYRPAWGLVYAAFDRAVRNGFVDCKKSGHQTVYLPRSEGA